MKQLYKIYSIVLFLLCLGCENSDILLYEQNAGIYFESSAYGYSFLENPDLDSKKIKLSVDISGAQVDYDRKFIVTHPNVDTLTTAEKDQFKIYEGVVKANEYNGSVEIELFKDDRLKDSVYKIALVIEPSDEFPEIRLNKKTIVISFTNMVIQPANWRWLRWYFGTPFSTRWWTFICTATGRTSLPYFPTHADKETWWMSVDEVKAYQTITKLALEEYNAKHPDDPLTHDDGDYKGQRIEMP